MLKFIFKKLLFLSLFLSLDSIAGSCCGGGAGAVSFITGDAHNVFRAIYSNRTILSDVDASYNIQNRPEDELETIETLILSSSFKLSSRLQFGLSLPYVVKTREINGSFSSDSGGGDLSMNAAYEIYPEYTRKQLITQAFVYTSLTFPTAPSLFNSKRSDLLDTRGQGHYLLSFGSLLKKNISTHSFLMDLSLTLRKGNRFDDSEFTTAVTTKSSLDNKLSFSHIFNLSNRINTLLSFQRSFIHNQAVSIFSTKDQSLALNQVTFGLNYSFETVDLILSYIDDFLIGQSKGTILGRSATVGFVKRI